MKQSEHNSKEEESLNQKHLRVVNEIADIFEREFTDSDDIFFVIRTLRNIFLFDTDESHTQWLFQNALQRFADSSSNREWLKNNFNFKDK